MKKPHVLLTLFLFFTLPLFSQTKSEVDRDAITKIVDNYLSDDSPGAAVGIVKDGQIVYEYYLGYANLEHQVKVDQNTRFNIASNAKQYTALCILQLVKAGKLKLEDDFRTYLPEFYPEIEDKITIANLINHTSGIRDYCDLIALTGKTWWQQFIDNQDALELLQAQKELNFKPGTEYTYSNSNYILLTEIIRKVTGEKFSSFTKKMFEKLDMPSTNFQTHYGEIIPHRARPYGKWNVWRDEPTITEVHGDGALYTNLRDQLKWEQIIQKNNGQYLSPNLINASQSLIENSIDNYGYGLMFMTYGGFEHTYHDGVTAAYRASFLRFPTENLSIVLMSNNRNIRADVIATLIADLMLGIKNGFAIHPENPERVETLTNVQSVVGSYKGDNGNIIKIIEKDGTLYREMYQRDPVKLLPERGGLFEYETMQGLKMNFTNIGYPDQKFTLYRSTMKPMTYRKLSNSDVDTFAKNDLNGRFFNEETGTEIILKFVEGNTYSLTKNGRERKAELVVSDFLRMNSYEIAIIRDKANQVVGLKVKNQRIKNVIFDRS